MRRGRGPQAQRVDAPCTIADYRAIVGDTQEIGWAVGREPDHRAVQLEGCIQWHDIDLPRADNFPGVGMPQPVIRLFALKTIADLLTEDAILIAETVADGGILQ